MNNYLFLRNNVGTHPTTSTQTRSTPRPHVFHSHGIGSGPVSDPFLPCNSHHLRRLSTPNVTVNQNQPRVPARLINAKHVNGDRFLRMLHRNLPNPHFTANRKKITFLFKYTIVN